MTYPQQYPPQGYAPQPQQQYAPPQYGQPYPQQGYPQPQQYGQPQGYPQPAPAAAPPPPITYPTTLGDPDPKASSVPRPRLQDIGRANRLVLIRPLKIERNVPNTQGKPGDVQDRMTADVVIFDGGPVAWGGKPERGVPHTTQSPLPYEIPAMYISSGPIITQCERRMNEVVVGRLGITELPNGQTAYGLTNASADEKAIVTQFLFAKAQGQLGDPQPAQAAQPAQVSPPPQQYAQQPQAQPQYAPQQPPQAPQGYPQPQQYGPPQGVPQGPAPQAPPAWAPPQQQVDVNVVVPPHTPESWFAMPPEQRYMIAAAAASQQGPGI